MLVVLILQLSYVLSVILNTAGITTDNLLGIEMEPIRVDLIVAIIGIAALFVVSWLDRRNKKVNACKAISIEIDDHIDALSKGYYITERKHNSYYANAGRDALPRNRVAASKENIFYTNTFLATLAFDSIVNSGLFTEFSSDAQKRLLFLYERIKSRNETLSYLNRYEDIFFLYDTSDLRRKCWIKEIENYERHLTWCEKEIKDNLSLIKRTIEREKSAFRLGKTIFDR